MAEIIQIKKTCTIEKRRIIDFLIERLKYWCEKNNWTLDLHLEWIKPTPLECEKKSLSEV